MMLLTKFIVGLEMVGLMWFHNPNNDEFESGRILIEGSFVPLTKAAKQKKLKYFF